MGSFMGKLTIRNPGRRPGFLSLLLSIFLINLCFSKTYGQGLQEPQKSKLYPTAGITWRSTAMNFFDFVSILPDDPNKPFDYERNVQGFSLNIGIQYQLSNSVAIEYYPNMRYDVTHHKWDSKYDELVLVVNEVDSFFTNDKPIYIKKFLIDHNFNIMRKKGKLAYGLGLTIVNSGESYTFPHNHRAPNPIVRTHIIEFKTYNAFVTLPLKKIFNLELKAMYIPRDFPENVSEKYIMYSIRVYYKFDFLN
ncbi:MAG: hypothetical protein GY816_10890 [Cytophagales bacterium]|nr:hypothetical protein [Cytophagales bacterium]